MPRKKIKKGVSDGNLCSLWRKAVLAVWGHKCFFCGNTNLSEIECHHIKKRKHKLTRYMVENGIPACKVSWGKKESCHQFAETFEGQAEIKRNIGDDLWFKLDRLARQIIKNWLLENEMTETEFLLEKKKELEVIIEKHKVN